MKLKSIWLMLAGMVATTASAQTYTYGFEYATTSTQIDSTTPIVGPSVFENLLPAQAQPISYDAATFSGGAVLTDASFFPAHTNFFPHNLLTDGTYDANTNHNAYGSSNLGSGAGLISDLVTINFLAGDHPDFVSFTLFNGLTTSQTYTVTAHNGNGGIFTFDTGNLNSNQFTPNSNSNSPNKNILEGIGSFEAVNINYLDIAYITIAPKAGDSSSSGGWDYLIDDVTFIGNGVAPAVPEPETYAMLLAGFGVMGFVARRRKIQ